ncbi:MULTISPECIES: sucrase ferredoxin [Cryobacterium]|uniref:Sucrase ferredoxin n=1 Tax=Cryobacterium zongtaii TaxID=1259217 RepID=A0A2S3Z9G8_9MICO|nr:MULTISPECIES: sucrase ferredoxin [Cryobacterium]POH62187.1 sucrase ferredoxin [Cryobacterium zongtaii]POH67955.1 sucrase ferredoxin [Cryobacterium zongtaii]TFC47959.1 sucrase ferredoxin [Cryobacterium sp. TMN-39-2]
MSLPSAPGWLPCSDRSLERGDPLPGTAGYGERWFLVEIDGAWGAHAFLQSPLDPALARALVTRIESAGIRPLAIRRTGRTAHQRRAQTEWRWAAVDARVGHERVHWGVVTDPADLLQVPLDGATGAPSTEPLICVCTHARHDQCCAVKGRPVVTALAQAYPAATWECSHLGGDRFAATLILFPHGLYYGRVTGAEAPDLVDAYLDGRIEPRWFRGRSSLPNVVQAAAAFARANRGDDRIDAFDYSSWTESGGVHTVSFIHGDERLAVKLAESLSAPLLSTCAASTARPVREFELRSITPG